MADPTKALEHTEFRRPHGRPRTLITSEEFKSIWEDSISGLDLFDIQLKHPDIAFEAIQKAIETYSDTVQPVVSQERSKLIALNKASTIAVVKRLEKAQDIAAKMETAIDDILEGCKGNPSLLDQKELAAYESLVRSYQFQLASITKLNAEVRNNSDMISNLVGAKKRPTRAKANESDEDKEKPVGDGTHEPLAEFSSEQLVSLAAQPE
jgi:hypothetical protein